MSAVTFSDCGFRDCPQSLRVKSITVPPPPRYARSLSNPSNYSIMLSWERGWGGGAVVWPPRAAGSKGKQNWRQINSLNEENFLRLVNFISLSQIGVEFFKKCDFCKFVISVRCGCCDYTPQTQIYSYITLLSFDAIH